MYEHVCFSKKGSSSRDKNKLEVLRRFYIEYFWNASDPQELKPKNVTKYMLSVPRKEWLHKPKAINIMTLLITNH